MSLSPVKTTLGSGIPTFASVLETLTGGFSFATTGFTTGADVPAGSFLYVDEAARTATLAKTAVLKATGGGTGHKVAKGHHFIVGDYLALTVGAKAYAITGITTTNASHDRLIVGTAIDNGATGAVLWASSATGATSAAIKNLPNALSLFGTTLGSGEMVTAVIRGTAYRNRLQKHVTGHLAGLKHIHVSTSY